LQAAIYWGGGLDNFRNFDVVGEGDGLLGVQRWEYANTPKLIEDFGQKFYTMGLDDIRRLARKDGL
jgi:hypothetical protein